MSKLTKIIDNLKYYVVDSTALLTETFPVFAAWEVGVVGMSNDVSINAKMVATGLVFGGSGWAMGKGRDLWRRSFNIVDSTKEKVQAAHDFLYQVAFNSVFLPPFYYASGERDLETLAIASGTGVAVAATNGLALGPFMDMYRDLTGLKECERSIYPRFIKNQSPITKKAIATGLVAGSVGLMGLIYSQNT
tara:strand:+ start:20024 stop:20596 length:573 start_codon:yes stop_codon:yes gene_type:complete